MGCWRISLTTASKCKVALFLAEELNKRGQRIDLCLVEAASLLHDIAKTNLSENERGPCRIRLQSPEGIGYERVGEIVAQHVWLKREGDPSSVSEEEVVNYADKRVRHDQIVSLEERFKDLKRRYGKDQSSIDYLERMEKAILWSRG